jgi:hypothetical protein
MYANTPSLYLGLTRNVQAIDGSGVVGLGGCPADRRIV